ncbi:MAG TPA: peptidyl-prolyl cis-trans isomerase [bacterium]|nr:peptidyl-prolyl cis-trans isomerase [bacterium]
MVRLQREMWSTLVFLMAVVMLAALLGCGESESPQVGTPEQRAQQEAPVQPGAAKTVDESDALARIGDVTITNADLEQEIADIPVYMQTKFKTKSGKIELLNKMVENELLAKAAVDAELDKDPDIMRKIVDARKKILQNEYYRTHLKDRAGVEDEKVTQYYEANKDKYKTMARARVRMIVFSDEKAGQKTLEELKKDPKKFEQLARERSKDESTAGNGGLLGWVTDGGYIRGLGKDPGVNDAVFALSEGQMSDVIRAKKGSYVIVKVESLQPAAYRPLEEVRRRIADDLLVNDEEIKKYYDEHKDEFISKERLKARILVLENEKGAKQARQGLLKGLTVDKFSEYAKKNSIDKTNARNGGYLGYITQGRYIPGIGRDPAIEKVIFALNENGISEPVKTKKGWSLFYVEKKEPSTMKPLERVRTLIMNKLRRQVREQSQNEAMNALKSKYGCQVFEDKVTGTESESEPEQSGPSSRDIRDIFKPK